MLLPFLFFFTHLFIYLFIISVNIIIITTIIITVLVSQCHGICLAQVILFHVCLCLSHCLCQKHQKEKLRLNLSLVPTPVAQVSEHCLLAVTVDEQPEWETHINNIRRTVFRFFLQN